MCSVNDKKKLKLQGPQLLNKFDPRSMTFLVWQNSFEFLTELLEVSDDNKSYLLLNMLESNVVGKIRKKIGDIELLNLSYDMLMSKLEELFSNYQEEFAARFRFDWRDQLKGESVKQYAKALTKLIVKCNYGSETYTYLINRFILGLRNKKAQIKLFKMKNLTFDKAVDIAETIDFFDKLSQQDKNEMK